MIVLPLKKKKKIFCFKHVYMLVIVQNNNATIPTKKY